MIAVIDYCKGNLKSVERGLRVAGGNAFITENPSEIAQASALVLPGVGSFADAATTMQASGQMEAIKKALDAGKPFLGICLGQHLLFEAGTEHAEKNGSVAGIGIIEGVVDKMPSQDSEKASYKIPHVGWNSIEFKKGASTLFEGIPSGEYFYFTHSYISPDSNATIATTTHSVTFPSAVQVGDRIFGVQFHPEKSSSAGIQVLHNFITLSNTLAQTL